MAKAIDRMGDFFSPRFKPWAKWSDDMTNRFNDFQELPSLAKYQFSAHVSFFKQNLDSCDLVNQKS